MPCTKRGEISYRGYKDTSEFLGHLVDKLIDLGYEFNKTEDAQYERVVKLLERANPGMIPPGLTKGSQKVKYTTKKVR